MIVSQTRDGGDRKNLVEGTEPTWDADGKKIAYVTPGYRISKINADGTGKRHLSSPYAEPGEKEMIDTRPAWSPTGKRVVFQRTWEGTARKIMIINVDGTPGPRALTSGTRPEWSSRGQIAFLRRSDGLRRVYIIRPNGDERTVVPHTRRATDVTWAPKGMRLAFVTPGADDAECLYIVRVDGSNKELGCAFRGADGGNIQGITWAPNGNSLLVGIQDFFDEPLHSEGRIVRVLLDGSKERHDATGYMPDWQPRP